ncbi:MAG TPA: LytR C-terminal domain-containing protein, partial [Pseudonocardia sp.]|nr:LytR C-terminal domain-containing protein [Pseudonocardia sp.]
PAGPTGEVPVPSFPATTNAIAAPTAAPGTAGEGGAGTGGGGGGGTGTGAGTGGGAGGGGPAVVRAPVRVYNNSTITGLASHAAADFRADGWQVEQVSNYPSGLIPTSTVYFRPGTSEQSAAATLASAFGLRTEPRFQGIDDATPGLIVIVTNDYQKR